MSKYNLAFVVPRFAEDIVGGAETLVAHLARHLQSEGHKIEILTTCAKDNRSWENFYPAGDAREFNLPVKRFKVDERDLEVWIPLQVKISQGLKLTLDDQLLWMQESVNSSGLYEYILKNQNNFDHFIFAPYLFGTTFWGSMLLPEKSILLPCLHDEVYAYLELTASMFRQTAGCIFNAKPEQDLAETLYGQISGGEVGMGFNLVSKEAASKVESYNGDQELPENFLLYLGRKETGKNLHLLIDYFLEYRSHFKELKLVIAGGGSMDDIKDHLANSKDLQDAVIDLGRVTEAEKQGLLKDCLALVQPSVNESFSIVLMEAWQFSKPVIVHADCAVTRDHVTESNAGFYFKNAKELAGIIKFCLNEPEQISLLGELGYDYVKTKYSWEAVVKRFHKVYNLIQQQKQQSIIND